jgi:hypothetical protein
MVNIDFHNIRPINGDLREGFEEFVTQLARKEKVPQGKRFIRKGRPDAGIECYWELENGTLWAWQTKYFISSPGGTQWKQISDSVKTAIKNYKNITKYFIVMPIDPPDAEKGKKSSTLDKWFEYVKKWNVLSKNEGLNIEFIPWWNSDLITRLQTRENEGLALFWFDRESFTNEWFLKKIEKAIADLGNRYTPQLNFELPVAKTFDGIARDDHFLKQFYDTLDSLLININEVSLFGHTKELSDKIFELKNKSKDLESEYQKLENMNNEYYDFNGPLSICQIIQNILFEIEDIIRNHQGINEDKKRNNMDNIRSELNHIYQPLNDFINFLSDNMVKLFNKPYLLIDGEAGVGKSHLLGDIVQRRKKGNKYSLLLLGQQFKTSENPEQQILNNLDLKCSFEDLLEALSCKAQISGSRIIIFIDAINEGSGIDFWPEFFNGFLRNFLSFEWLGLVLTIRSSYINVIKDNIDANADNLIREQHYGFENNEYDAVKLFFGYYGIELPGNPILNPEFRNPLFLRLFCEGLHKLKLTKIPYGLQGITAIFQFYINSVNESLSKPRRFDYSSSKNIVMNAINVLIKYMVDKKTREIPFDAAFDLIENNISRYLTRKGKFLDELIAEGIFSRNIMRNEKNEFKEYIYFVYEKFADHLICSYLLDRSDDLEKDLKKGGMIYDYLYHDGKLLYTNHGVIEALAIQIPERINKEIYEYIDKPDSPLIKDSFISSLQWRKTDTLNLSCLDYINKYFFKTSYYFDLFLETIISVATVKGNCFNALFLHCCLMKHSLADRDMVWTYFLRYRYDESGPVKKLIDWAWDDYDKSHISDDTIKLASIVLAWFHTSTDRELRDMSTKALIFLLKNRIHVLIEVLKLFENVNDPYVYERLFAVAYGCVMLSNKREEIGELAEYVYSAIFKDKEEIYPHILLRDYARNVIEFACYLKLPLSFDINLVRPPYKSILDNKKISNNEIDTRYASTDVNKKSGQDKILHSMVTEYGRGVCMYGDFGRYIFETKFYNFKVNADEMSNMAIELIFEKYGYSEEKHGQYDNTLSYNGRQQNRTERIGKKYQWMAMHEILARVADNCEKQERWSSDKEGLYPYQGTWDPFARDIDPSLLIRSTPSIADEDISDDRWWEVTFNSNFNCADKEWLDKVAELPKFEDLIEVKDTHNENWLILQAYPEWREPKRLGKKKWGGTNKNIWSHIRGYICKKNDLKRIITWAKKQNFSGRWMPENIDKYVLFSRESYWSPGYQYCIEQDDYGNPIDIWDKIVDKNSEKNIAPIIIPVEEYTWEKDNDYSIDDTISLIKPGKFIFEGLNMQYADDEGYYLDETGNLICFNTSIKYNSKQYLLIKKIPFLDFLNKNDLEMFWTILGEKQVLGDFSAFSGRLDYSGIYYFDENVIKGHIKTFRLKGQI